MKFFKGLILCVFYVSDELREAEGDLMSCKVYQLAEAAPQFVLQSAFLLQDYEIGKLPKFDGHDSSVLYAMHIVLIHITHPV